MLEVGRRGGRRDWRRRDSWRSLSAKSVREALSNSVAASVCRSRNRRNRRRRVY